MQAVRSASQAGLPAEILGEGARSIGSVPKPRRFGLTPESSTLGSNQPLRAVSTSSRSTPCSRSSRVNTRPEGCPLASNAVHPNTAGAIDQLVILNRNFRRRRVDIGIIPLAHGRFRTVQTKMQNILTRSGTIPEVELFGGSSM